jgi:hypothetical protein
LVLPCSLQRIELLHQLSRIVGSGIIAGVELNTSDGICRISVRPFNTAAGGHDHRASSHCAPVFLASSVSVISSHGSAGGVFQDRLPHIHFTGQRKKLARFAVLYARE